MTTRRANKPPKPVREVAPLRKARTAPDWSQREESGQCNSRDVARWFKAHYPSAPSWTVKDKVNAKRMLAEFGASHTHKAVDWFCENFDGYVTSSRGKLSGVPNPSLMWAMRAIVFPDFEAGRIPGEVSAEWQEKREKQLASRLARGEYSEEDAENIPDDPTAWGLD